MQKHLLIVAMCVLVLLSGCVGARGQYETTPVEVQSAKGVVLCQLYTRERVLWDRAIEHPPTISAEEADDICRAEGERRKASG